MILKSNKSAIEWLHQLEDEQRDYKEYIESWRSIRAFAGLRSGFSDDLSGNQRIETYVDMVLYCARSEAVYKDYQIQKTDLNEIL